MTSKTKIWLTTAALLVLTGLIIFGGIMIMLKWDFTKLSTIKKYETNEYQISEGFTNISVSTKTANLTFVKTDEQNAKVVCHEQKNVSHLISVNDGTLTVELKDKRKWYEYIGFNFESAKITVYLPADKYGICTVKTSTGDVELPKDFAFESLDVSGSTGDVTCYASATGGIKFNLSTGDIRLESLSAGSFDLTVSTGKINAVGISCSGELKAKVDTGKINLTDVTCKTLVSDGDTGDMYLKNVIAKERFDIKRDTGNVSFDCCDAGEIFVTTDTGHVKGTLLSEKVFIPRSKTGKIDVPKTTSGGVCEITTDTGNIMINISPR